MKTKELLLQEMETAPEPILAEVLDFLKFLKAKHTQPGKQVTVVSADGETAVPLTALAIQAPEVASYLTAVPMPVQQMCNELKNALTREGYLSTENIIGLVRDVKQEMLSEQESQQTTNHS